MTSSLQLLLDSVGVVLSGGHSADRLRRDCNWNCHILFGHHFSQQGLCSRKMEVVRCLGRMHSVVMLQETHGVPGDHLTLRALLPTHTVYENFGSHTGVGGTVLLVHNQILGQAVDIQHDTWLEGALSGAQVSHRAGPA